MTELFSTRSYFVRAMREWVEDNHLTSYLLVDATLPNVSVPNEYVQDGRILLNVSSVAVKDLSVNHEFLSFSARFSGIVKQVNLPIQAVLAIYAKENGKGLFFDQVGDIVPPPPITPGPSIPPLGSSNKKQVVAIKNKKARANLRVIK